ATPRAQGSDPVPPRSSHSAASSYCAQQFSPRNPFFQRSFHSRSVRSSSSKPEAVFPVFQGARDGLRSSKFQISIGVQGGLRSSVFPFQRLAVQGASSLNFSFGFLFTLHIAS